jgi:hypothetical protein
MNIFAPDGKVVYDSAQVSINRRLSDGIQFTAAYSCTVSRLLAVVTEQPGTCVRGSEDWRMCSSLRQAHIGKSGGRVASRGCE